MNRILWLALTITLTLMAGGIGLAFFLAGKITRPLQELVAVTNKVSSGDLNSRADIKTGDEISSLASSFNRMIERVQEKTGQLEEVRNSLEIKVLERTRELEETHRQLLEANKLAAMGTLSSGIAHDFNNILFAIRGNAELLKLEFPPGSKQYKFINAVETSATRGAELTKKLKNFARPHELFRTSINLNNTIREIIELLAPILSGEKTISIVANLEPGLWNIQADSSQIYQVILNTCVNAKEAVLSSSSGSGTIAIKTQNKTISPEELRPSPNPLLSNKFVMVSITDTGTGMDEETLKHIFEPFFTTKIDQRVQGVGLGLSVVYGIIKSHNGFIKVTSGKNKGSCFEIHFPATEEKITEATGAQKEGNNRSSEKRGTILLVDDETPIREVGQSMLEHIGYNVIGAAGGKEAVEIYQQQKNGINLVLLDLIMPGWDGRETLKALKEINPSVKVIISSGYHNHEMDQEINQAGVNGFIQKPYSIKELLEIVEHVL